LASGKGRGWTLLLIPEGQSGTRQFRLPRKAVYLLAGALTLVVLYAVVETVLFWAVARRAAEADNLRLRVRELENSSAELLRMGTELSKLQAFERQVRKVLGSGGKTEMESAPWIPPTSSSTPFGAANTGITPISRPATGPVAANASFSAADLPTMAPVSGFLTRGFIAFDDSRELAHHGVDLAAKEGTPVVAAADGIVISAGWSYPYGNLVSVAHRSGYFSFYGHNQLLLVRTGDRVRQGEPIALVGNSGVSSAPHLHFEVWYDGQPIDPTSLIRSIP
jgi:murein DD-endopeptidase MepM/ murein hydrolase activator NlpD